MINKHVPLSQPTDTYRLGCTDVCAFCGVFIQDLPSQTWVLIGSVWLFPRVCVPRRPPAWHKKRRCLTPSLGGVRSQSFVRSWPYLYKSIPKLGGNPTSDKTCLERSAPYAWSFCWQWIETAVDVFSSQFGPTNLSGFVAGHSCPLLSGILTEVIDLRSFGGQVMTPLFLDQWKKSETLIALSSSSFWKRKAFANCAST